jgi:hypothetical protein
MKKHLFSSRDLVVVEAVALNLRNFTVNCLPEELVWLTLLPSFQTLCWLYKKA